MKKSIILLLCLSLLLVLPTCNISNSPKFVWEDQQLEERSDYLMFRNSFTAESEAEGVIHVFADSRYHLFVNGSFINFGPLRFYPEHPQYDSYDVSEYLVEGENVLAVKVLSNGMNTYQVPLSQAGFIAWGEISVKGKKLHDLHTPGTWKCMEVQGYDRATPKMSFATGAVESFNAALDPSDWNKPGFNDSEWKEPEIITKQEYWGDLTPRSIPHLSQEKKSAATLLGAYTLEDTEEIYSFRVASADRTRKEFNTNKYAFAYTYIYSPVKQKVQTGLWWGEHWLNGKGPLKNLGTEKAKPNRSDIVLDLEQGWNFFFIKYGIVWASWNFYMAIPEDAGLELSPDMVFGSENIFMTAGPFADAEEDLVRSLDLPFSSPGDLPELSASWTGQARNGSAGNPAWDIAWSYFNKEVELEEDDGLIIPEERQALVYDMGSKTLGRIFVDIVADSGTVIDVAFSEDLQGVRPWILKRAGIYTAVRFIAADGLNHLESFKPYGARYLQVNIAGHKSPVRIQDAGMISQVYPFEKLGSFECSDTMLNAIWELGWRTLLVCSEDSYTDTPFRERGLYAGDALPEYAISLAGSGDSRLMKQSIFLFSDMYEDLMNPGKEKVKPSVNHMADFPLITLLSYAWAVNRTGDLDFAERYYDRYKHMLELLAAGRMENDLLEHNRAFIEWTKIDKDATLTAIQSLAIQCFHSMAYVASLLGKTGDIPWYEEQADITNKAMHRHCWDPDKGAFRDGFKHKDAINNYYPISSMWPTLFGQTTADQEEKLQRFYAESYADIGDKDRDRLTTPYGGFYVLGGLYAKGYTRIAEDFLKKYWSPMIVKHNDTAWENFGDGSDGKGQGTLSHAWSGGPTYHMSAHILGVDLGFPHFSHPDTIVLQPQAESLNWARGTVPHPDGIVEVDWKVDGDNLYYNCSLPDNVVWSVEPRGRLAHKKLWINNVKNDE